MTKLSFQKRISLILSSGMLIAAAATNANATVVPHFIYQNGGNACTGALPTYEGSLRKRPKAIVNQGDVPAFATCSDSADSVLLNPNRVVAFLSNHGSAPVDVSCTMVNGDEVSGATYTVLTKTMPVGQVVPFIWLPTAPDTTFDYELVGTSCLLPPSVEIDIFAYYADEII